MYTWIIISSWIADDDTNSTKLHLKMQEELFSDGPKGSRTILLNK